MGRGWFNKFNSLAAIQSVKLFVLYRTARPILTTGMSPAAAYAHNVRSEIDRTAAASRLFSKSGCIAATADEGPKVAGRAIGMHGSG